MHHMSLHACPETHSFSRYIQPISHAATVKTHLVFQPRDLKSSSVILALVQAGESWNRAIKPKALGAWNLHELSTPAKSLEHFIVFSSVVSSIGHQGAHFFLACNTC